MDNIIGPPVEGDDFFGRESESKRIWELLSEGNNILLLGPRRIGKTSMMRHVRSTAPAKGFIPVELSLAGMTEELEFVRRFYAEIEKRPEGKEIVRAIVGGPLNRFIKAFTPSQIDLGFASFEFNKEAQDQWATFGETLTEALGKDLKHKWLFLLDEVSLFVQSLIDQDETGQRARKFLNWMRELRIGPRAPKQNRWFITGSIGLPTITKRVSLGDTINDLKEFDNFGVFSKPIAEAFLKELTKSKQIDFPEEVIQEIIHRVGWLIPFFLHHLFSRLRDQSPPYSKESVTQAIEAMLKAGRGTVFDFWEQRIHRQLKSPDDKHALAILAPIARDPNGANKSTIEQNLARHIQEESTRQEQLGFLLGMLESDGYIVLDNDRYRFLSPLLREYWVRYNTPS